MSDLDLVAFLPDVAGAVLGELSGAHLESVREPDGEAVAAVAGVVASTLVGLGEDLGLGALRRVTVTAPSRARVLLLRARTVLSCAVEPGRSLPAVERALEGLD